MKLNIRATVMDDGRSVGVIDGEVEFDDRYKPTRISCYGSSFGTDEFGKKKAKAIIRNLGCKALHEMYLRKSKSKQKDTV